MLCPPPRVVLCPPPRAALSPPPRVVLSPPPRVVPSPPPRAAPFLRLAPRLFLRLAPCFVLRLTSCFLLRLAPRLLLRLARAFSSASRRAFSSASRRAPPPSRFAFCALSLRKRTGQLDSCATTASKVPIKPHSSTLVHIRAPVVTTAVACITGNFTACLLCVVRGILPSEQNICALWLQASGANASAIASRSATDGPRLGLALSCGDLFHCASAACSRQLSLAVLAVAVVFRAAAMLLRPAIARTTTPPPELMLSGPEALRASRARALLTRQRRCTFGGPAAAKPRHPLSVARATGIMLRSVPTRPSFGLRLQPVLEVGSSSPTMPPSLNCCTSCAISGAAELRRATAVKWLELGRRDVAPTRASATVPPGLRLPPPHSRRRRRRRCRRQEHLRRRWTTHFHPRRSWSCWPAECQRRQHVAATALHAGAVPPESRGSGGLSSI